MLHEAEMDKKHREMERLHDEWAKKMQEMRDQTEPGSGLALEMDLINNAFCTTHCGWVHPIPQGCWGPGEYPEVHDDFFHKNVMTPCYGDLRMPPTPRKPRKGSAQRAVCTDSMKMGWALDHENREAVLRDFMLRVLHCVESYPSVMRVTPGLISACREMDRLVKEYRRIKRDIMEPITEEGAGMKRECTTPSPSEAGQGFFVKRARSQ